ncbi:hypothetical protein SprV_0200785600 [Sparganum proliferum]
MCWNGRNPQHLRHAETNGAEMERPPGAHGRRATTQTTPLRRLRDGVSPPRRPNSSIQGHSEVLPEASANQPNRLGRARPRSSDLEEDSKNRCCDLRSQPHRCRQSETRSPQITTSPCTQRERTTASIVSLVSTDIPGSNQTCWTSSDQMHLSNYTNCRPPPAYSSSSLPPTNSDSSSEPPLPSSSSSSSSSSPSFSTTTTTTTTTATTTTTSTAATTTTTTTTTSTTAAPAAVSHVTNPATTTDTTPTASDSSDEDQYYTCPHCDRTFTSHIGLLGHLRIHRTETSEPVPVAPTYAHRTRLYCPQCPRTFTHYMGLFATCAYTRAELTTVPTHPSCQTPHPLHYPAPLPPLFQLTPTTPTSPTHTVHAHSPRASAWSVTCESIAQRLENQCLEHQPIPTTLVSTAHTVLALSGIAWASSATCTSTTTCGRQPPATSHHNTIRPASCTTTPDHTSILIRRKHPPATSHASGKCASRLGPHAAPVAQVT